MTALNSLHVKLKVLYITENVIDQCQKNTFVEYASGIFEFRHSIDSDNLIILIKKLHFVYCMNYSRTAKIVEDFTFNTECSKELYDKISQFM